MIRSFRRAALLLPVPFVVGCSSVLGYESDYELGANAGASGASVGVGGTSAGGAGTAGSGVGGTAGGALAGQSGNAGAGGTSGASGAANGGSGGNAGGAGATGGGGNGNSGNAGTGTSGNGGIGGATGGGNAGTTNGGAAGATNGGNAGAANGGNAGATNGGNAGTTNGGNAGATNGGNAGATNGGNAGATSGGNAGATSGGNAGATSGGNAGTSGGAGAAGASGGQGGAGGSPNPTDCSVIYVSPKGSAANDGCSPSTPVLTPLQGIAAAVAVTKEVRLCEGTFPGALVLSKKLSLRGSYDCATWTRGALSAAGPLTKITSSSSSPPLFVNGANVTRDVVIEGLYLQGSDGGSRSRGLVVGTNAQPTIRHNLIEARNAKSISDSSTPLTVGLVVESGAGPRVEDNIIRSGDADAGAALPATAGVVFDSLIGPVELARNQITAGQATLHGRGYGSFGLYVEVLSTQALTGPNAIRDNVIRAGDAIDLDSSVELLSSGIFFDETSMARGQFEVVGGVIVAGRVEHGGAGAADVYPKATGISSGGHVALQVDHARIYGGDAPTPRGSATALDVSGTGTTTVVTSALHGGGALFATRFPRAIDSRSNGTLTVNASTLFSGFARPINGEAGGGVGLNLSSPGRVVLQNNLFVMHSEFTVAIQLSGACSAPVASVLVGNAFGSTAPGHSLFEGSAPTPSPGCDVTDTSLPGLNARFPDSKRNIRISPTTQHASELNLACSDAAACFANLLATFTSEQALRTSLIDRLDGSFGPKRCSLAQPSDAVAVTETDLLGRPVPDLSPSVGALQAPPDFCP